MNSLFGRLSSRRLLSTFTILVTLSAGILIGSVVARGVRGQEKKVDSSDARPLTVPNPVELSSTFAQISKDVEPAVVNISTESLPKQSNSRRNFRNMPQNPNNDDNGGGDDEDNGGPQSGPGGGDQGMQDFFNHFFGQGPDGGNPFGGQQGPREALGSGFIVDSRGYILTNNHVVDKADRILVKLSNDPEGDAGRPAKVVGVDKATDIAVIKIETNTPLPTVKMGNSDAMEVGDWVLAIGSPFGLQHTVTAGIVSSKNRDIEPGVTGQFQRFIQTDAAINPGNSGGPLVNMRGEVIGINTAIYTQSMGYQGVGFAMPSNTVVATYNQLIGPTHKVTRGSIGIGFQSNLPTAVGRVYGFKSGVLISSVDPGSPAEKAGLRSGDIITSVDGKEIKNGDDLVALITSKQPGSTVRIGYMRNGKSESATVGIADRDKILGARNAQSEDQNQGMEPEQGATSATLGVSIKPVSPQMAQRLGVTGGVEITNVKPGTFADEIGLAPGMVITEINRKPVNNTADVHTITGGLKSGDDVVLTIRSPQGGNNYLGGTLP
jgi:serine protease Do